MDGAVVDGRIFVRAEEPVVIEQDPLVGDFGTGYFTQPGHGGAPFGSVRRGDAAVGGGLRFVRDIGCGEGPGPAGEFEQYAVGVLEVERAHEGARVHLPGDSGAAVVVIEHATDLDPLGPQPLVVLVELLRWY